MELNNNMSVQLLYRCLDSFCLTVLRVFRNVALHLRSLKSGFDVCNSLSQHALVLLQDADG